MGRNVTTVDLDRAIEWLRHYEGDEDDPNNAAGVHAVADWLEREAERREKAAAVRHVARETGRSEGQIRAALRQRTATLSPER